MIVNEGTTNFFSTKLKLLVVQNFILILFTALRKRQEAVAILLTRAHCYLLTIYIDSK